MAEIPIMVMPWHRPDPCKPLKMQSDAAFKASHLDYLTSLNIDSPPLTVPLTKIVCTIGSASKDIDTMVDLMEQGMVIALVPLAMGSRKNHIDTIANLRIATTAYSQMKNRVFPLGIAVQTKGPGLRIGGLKKDVPVDLAFHHKITLSTDKAWRTKSTEHYLYIGFPDMCQVLTKGDVLLVGDGIVVLQVQHIDQNEIVCEVVKAGIIHSFMPVSIPNVPLRLPPMTDEDMDDLRMVATLGVDIVLATGTKTANHIREVRKILAEDENGSGIKVWAQIDCKQGLDNLKSILEDTDAVMLSRAGLTKDLLPEKLFLVQKIVLASCNKVGIPVFISSHYLPSMQTNKTPSMAELNDVASAILDGVDGFLLGNTTSIGRHPEDTVSTLTNICVEAEAAVWHHQMFSYLNLHAPPPIDPTHAIAISAVEGSLKASAAAIFLNTTSGRSAQLVARYRPRCPIIAVTRYGQVARQLNTWRAIIPLHYVDAPLPDWFREVDVRLQFGIEFAKQKGIVHPGDPIVLLSSWRQGAGFTNTIRIVYASDSFPWVYPHTLPSSIPSDKNISDSDSINTTGTVKKSVTSETRTNPIQTSLASTLLPPKSASADIPALSKAETKLVSVEGESKPRESTASEEVRVHILNEVFKKSEANASAFSMTIPEEKPSSEMAHVYKDVSYTDKSDDKDIKQEHSELVADFIETNK